MTHNLSAPAENCLLLVHRLMERSEPVSTSTLARGLGVTDSTATAMIQKLTKYKLLNHQPRKDISLTDKGRELAVKMIRRHRLIESYLQEKLGYSWEEVHAEAEQIEHFVSDRFVDAISEVLGHPTTDPHGDPIPDKDGSEDRRTLTKLSDARPGSRARVARVIEESSEALIYLADRGLKPGVELTIIEAPQHDNIFRLQIGEREVSIGGKLASQIMVESL
jgi:DtxR family transcriptional regulator, Mn-dependent transcriptional regulator